MQRCAAIAVVSLGMALPVEGQDPQLPAGVHVPAGGPRMIVGIVVDSRTSPSLPLEGVVITIRGTDRRFITGDDGIFRFDSIAPGSYDVGARRIGYEPRVKKVKLPDGGNVVFLLTPLSQTLAAIVSSAVAGGVAGFVSDSSRTPLAEMSVRIYGTKSGRAVTDSSGQFHIEAPTGQYMMEVTGRGFRSELLSFNVPRDSGRVVSITLSRGRIPPRDIQARDDMQRRIAWRRFGSTLYTREDLAKMSGMLLTDIVRKAADRPFNEEECVLRLNGQPIAWPMWMYYAEDLDMVEVYPPGTMTVNSRGVRVPVNPGRDSRGGVRRACPTVFIWQRK
jgi:hypothetical protein